jgi:hypothetical protein
MNIRSKLCLGVTAIVGISGCMSQDEAAAIGEEQDVGEKVSSHDQDLYALGTMWPNGTVPVCFNSGTDLQKQQIRDHLYTSWSQVANVEFTGFGNCTGAAGVVPLAPNTGTGGNAHAIGYQGANATYTPVDLGTTDIYFTPGGIVAHELGHILGFAHEMARPDFVDDASRNDATHTVPGCNEANQTSTDFAGTPKNDYNSIMALGYCITNHRAALSRWDIVGARKKYGTRNDNVVSVGSTLYARHRSPAGDGFFYRWSGSTWGKVGDAGGQFITVGTTLYALTPDSSAVFRYNSALNWTQVGNAARVILQCGTSLCAENENGDLFRYSGSGTAWTQIGTAAAMYASTSGNVYRLTSDRQTVQSYSGTGMIWNNVGGAAGNLYATSASLFATDPTTGNINRYSGSGTAWSLAGGPGRQFVGVGSTLYGLTPDRQQVWRYSGSGTSWTQVGGPADYMYGGSTDLYATDPNTKDIYRYSGSGNAWSFVGQP